MQLHLSAPIRLLYHGTLGKAWDRTCREQSAQGEPPAKRQIRNAVNWSHELFPHHENFKKAGNVGRTGPSGDDYYLQS
jgi:hypothetical protein